MKGTTTLVRTGLRHGVEEGYPSTRHAKRKRNEAYDIYTKAPRARARRRVAYEASFPAVVAGGVAGGAAGASLATPTRVRKADAPVKRTRKEQQLVARHANQSVLRGVAGGTVGGALAGAALIPRSRPLGAIIGGTAGYYTGIPVGVRRGKKRGTNEVEASRARSISKGVTMGPMTELVSKADRVGSAPQTARERRDRRNRVAGGFQAGAAVGGVVGANQGSGRRAFATTKLGHAAERTSQVVGHGAKGAIAGGLVGTAVAVTAHSLKKKPAPRAGIAKAKKPDNPSAGRVVTGALLPVWHGAVAGKPGHKLKAAGYELGGTMIGAQPGAAVGTFAAHRAGHYKKQKKVSKGVLGELVAKSATADAAKILKDGLKFKPIKPGVKLEGPGSMRDKMDPTTTHRADAARRTVGKSIAGDISHAARAGARGSRGTFKGKDARTLNAAQNVGRAAGPVVRHPGAAGVGAVGGAAVTGGAVRVARKPQAHGTGW